MNKKSQLTSFVFGLFGLFILLLVATALVGIQKGGLEKERMIEIFDNSSQRATSPLNVSAENSPIINIIHSFVGFVIYSSFEVAKAAVIYGSDNPTLINPRTLIWLILISLLVPIFWTLLKLIIVIWILIKDFIQSRKEKILLKKKGDKNV